MGEGLKRARAATKATRNKPAKGSFEVKMRCTVIKLVSCVGCTEDEAMSNPWDFAEDEQEIEQMDYEVQSVKPGN